MIVVDVFGTNNVLTRKKHVDDDSMLSQDSVHIIFLLK